MDLSLISAFDVPRRKLDTITNRPVSVSPITPNAQTETKGSRSLVLLVFHALTAQLGCRD